MYVPLRGPDDHEGINHVHGVTPLRELYRRDRVWRAEIPVLNSKGHALNV